MYNVWKDINPERIKANDFIAFIEIEKGCKNKYELDKETGLIILDRVLSTSTHYPMNYGFIPRTFCEDKDPLDVCVLCSQAIEKASLVRCKPIGVLRMHDQGELDEKIVAVALKDSTYNDYSDVSELPKHIAAELQHFFTVYKQLENKPVQVDKIEGREAAIKVIETAIKLYKEKFEGGIGL
ncbi:MAG: inorganic diphosphatase [Christensenellaceae bacterium]|jgi:inorganic pyrophosphatase|nr:inorganic diphosphatase [Christensenellaceae bacterium]